MTRRDLRGWTQPELVREIHRLDNMISTALAMHVPCCTPGSDEPCRWPGGHRCNGGPVCVNCMDQDLEPFGYPCATVTALGVDTSHEGIQA